MKQNQADVEWATRIKLRANFKCEICGWDGNGISAHHIIPRTFKDVKYELLNGIALCPRCHKTGPRAAHRWDGNSVFFLFMLQKLHPERYEFAYKYVTNKTAKEKKVLEKNEHTLF